jgi:hypothetical protein
MTKLLLVALGLGILGMFPLIGIPGALLMVPGYKLMDLIVGAHTSTALNAKLSASVWAVAIGITLLWPFSIVPAWWSAKLATGGGSLWSIKGGVVFACVTTVVAIAITLAVLFAVLAANPVSDADRNQAAISTQL